MQTDPRFRLSAHQARALAEEFGTPLYVMDERSLREQIRAYRKAATDAYPKSEVVYASKANSTLAVIAIAYQEGCPIDVASEGELRAAIAAGVPAKSCYFHGSNKSEAEIKFALQQGIGQIIIDSTEEIEILSAARDPRPTLLLRLAPGVDPITHKKISTGQEDSKFGFNIADGSADRALARCLELGLPVVGFHCHVGSQLLDPEAQRDGGERLAQFAASAEKTHNFRADIVNIGGGLGVKYLDSDAPMPVEDYCRIIEKAVTDGLKGSSLDPVITQEPGRALVAESCLTLYTVGGVKTVPVIGGTRTYVAVDGGLSDNPRPALYDAEYKVEHLEASNETQAVTVAGKHCETDDLFVDIEVGTNIQRGHLLQVLCTGAYNSSMASNYNRYPRPATVLIRDKSGTKLVQRRETWDEMLAREITL